MGSSVQFVQLGLYGLNVNERPEGQAPTEQAGGRYVLEVAGEQGEDQDEFEDQQASTQRFPRDATLYNQAQLLEW